MSTVNLEHKLIDQLFNKYLEQFTSLNIVLILFCNYYFILHVMPYSNFILEVHFQPRHTNLFRFFKYF